MVRFGPVATRFRSQFYMLLCSSGIWQRTRQWVLQVLLKCFSLISLNSTNSTAELFVYKYPNTKSNVNVRNFFGNDFRVAKTSGLMLSHGTLFSTSGFVFWNFHTNLNIKIRIFAEMGSSLSSSHQNETLKIVFNSAIPTEFIKSKMKRTYKIV